MSEYVPIGPGGTYGRFHSRDVGVGSDTDCDAGSADPQLAESTRPGENGIWRLIRS
jgi:hypothetical protein